MYVKHVFYLTRVKHLFKTYVKHCLISLKHTSVKHIFDKTRVQLMNNTCCKFFLSVKAALAVNFRVFSSSSKLMYMKNKQYKHAFGSLFHLERNKQCSTFTIKGRGPGINSSQSKNVGKIQLSMQLSHLSINFENIWL